MRGSIGFTGDKLAAVAMLALGFSLACGTPERSSDAPITPTLGEASDAGDDAVAVVDRAEALAGAADAETLDAVGPSLPETLPRGFLLEIDSKDEVGALDDEIPDTRAATYTHALNGVAFAAVADVVTLAVVGPPAAAVAAVLAGAKAEVVPNVWVATNVITTGLVSSSGTFVSAWVGNGWLCELRVTSSDGVYNNAVWFNGYISEDQRVGWWDLYDGHGTLVGVVEWVDAGDGHSEFGIAAISGDNAGDVLAYVNTPDTAAVTYWDASAAMSQYVTVNPDRSGVVSRVELDGGAPGCWAPAEADEPYADVACPE